MFTVATPVLIGYSCKFNRVSTIQATFNCFDWQMEYSCSQDSTTNGKPNAVMVSHLQWVVLSIIQLRPNHFSAREMFLSIVLINQCTLV